MLSLETGRLYERFTDKAKEAFRRGYTFSKSSEHSFRSVHILRGLIINPSPCIVSTFEHFGLSVEKVISDISEVAFSKKESQECHNVALFAINSSKSRGDNYVGTEHVLSGILEQKETIASKILESNGLTKEAFDNLFNDPEKWSNLILR